MGVKSFPTNVSVSSIGRQVRGSPARADNASFPSYKSNGPTQSTSVLSHPAIDLSAITVVKPEHSNAHSLLMYRSMEDVPSSSIKLEADDGFEVEYSLDTISENTREKISSWIADYVNGSDEQLDASAIEDHIRNIARANQLDINPESDAFKFYINEASAGAEMLLAERLTNNLISDIYNTVLHVQHCGFLNGVPWEDLKQPLIKALIDQFVGNHPFGRLNSDETTEFIRNEVENAPGYDSVKFKAYKHETEPRLLATQVRSSSNPQKVFSLFKTPTNEQMDFMSGRVGNVKKTRVLGKGAFGEVKYAVDLQNMEVIVVKEVKSTKAAQEEIRQLSRVGSGDHLVSMRGYAQHIKKSYIFMDFAGSSSGDDVVKGLRRLRRNDPVAAENELNVYALHYLLAVSEIHANGLFHHDIKPANFSHSNQWLCLIDYGLSDSFQTRIKGGTRAYFPPETGTKLYRSDKHDAFSLGMTLLELKKGVLPTHLKQGHLNILGKSVDLRFNDQGRCFGLKGTAFLKGNALDEVIAKLLDRSPAERISVEDALKLPFFASMQTIPN